MRPSRSSMMPRDVRSAARTGAAFAGVGAVLLAVLAVTVPTFTPTPATRTAALVIAALLVGQGVVQLRYAERLPPLFWVTVPTQVVVIAVFLGLATHDASAAAQTFFIWPVLYAGYELRPRPAALVVLQVLVGEAVLTLRLLPIERAVTDIVCVGTSLAVLCALLVRARENHAAVVAELERRAAVDPLTGLATRRVLDEAASSALSTRRDEGTTLLLVDVDHFKAINDRLGHPVGDDALVHVATLLRAQFPGPALVARLGGDELAVLLPAATVGDVADRAERFRRRLAAEPLHVLGEPVPLTVSMGVAAGTGCEVQDLYAAADRALYVAKRAGRDGVAVDDGLGLEPRADGQDRRAYRSDDRRAAGATADDTASGTGLPAAPPLLDAVVADRR